MYCLVELFGFLISSIHRIHRCQHASDDAGMNDWVSTSFHRITPTITTDTL